MVRDDNLGKVYGSHQLGRIQQFILEDYMDLSKFKTSDWLKVGGGAVMLIAGFLTWWQPSCPSGVGSSECNSAIDSFGLDFTGFDLTFTGLIPWLLIVAIAILTVLGVMGIFKLPTTLPLPLIFLAASALSFLLVLIRFFVDPFDSGLGLSGNTERGIGLYLALLATAAVTVGCFIAYKESGGDVNDFRDMKKMRSQFGGAGNTNMGGGTPPPPPPPPGMNPPPPPPPMG